MNGEEFEKALKKTISPGKVRDGLVDNRKFGEFDGFCCCFKKNWLCTC